MFNIIIQTNDGADFDLREYQGDKNALVVFFRGAWCNHCKKQLQDINKRLAEFDTLNVRVVAISSDNKFNSSLLKNFLQLKFPVL
ncbi:MAG: redoxin domain-containing protein, partial [Parcubacteria group bacterium]